jgi:3-dehydroquinate synthase
MNRLSLTQEFSVPYKYEVFFTENLFEKENTLFKDFIVNFGNKDFQKKVLFVVDEFVAKSHKNLTNCSLF